MFNKIYQSFAKAYETKIDGRGLALFRILFSIVFLVEVLQLWYFRHLLFDKIPYLQPSEFDFNPIFLFWVLSILCIIFGLFTRIAALINYLLTVAVLGTISSFEYHMFYVYLAVNFLFIFLPVAQNFSIDRLLLKLKYSNTRFRYIPPADVSKLHYILVQLVGIAFVYFDSIFFKTTSHLWLNGMGLWLPASMPQAVFINISPILNNKYLILGLGYLTFLFEGVFLFTFWRKKWRLTLFIIGMGLHLGILVCFPIPLFAFGVCAIYLVMVPVSFWERLFSRKEGKTKYLRFFYDAECPLCNRTRIIINHFDAGNRIEFLPVQAYAASESALKDIPMDRLLDDIYSIDRKGKVHTGVDTYIRVFKSIWYLKPLAWIISVPGIYHLGKKVYKYVAANRTTERCTEDNCGYTPPVLPLADNKMKILTNFTLKDLKVRFFFLGFIFFCFAQLLVTYNSPLIRNLWKYAGQNDTKAYKYTIRGAEVFQEFSKTFWGITHHGVFMDQHFDGYNHAIAVVYKNQKGKEIWLPFTNKEGNPGRYISGFLWVKWTFRVNRPLIDTEKLENGIRDFTAFWAHKHHVDLKDATFSIRVKRNRVPGHWEYNFLEKQLQHPWIDAGTVKWVNNVYMPAISDIEKIN